MQQSKDSIYGKIYCYLYANFFSIHTSKEHSVCQILNYFTIVVPKTKTIFSNRTNFISLKKQKLTDGRHNLP